MQVPPATQTSRDLAAKAHAVGDRRRRSTVMSSQICAIELCKTINNLAIFERLRKYECPSRPVVLIDPNWRYLPLFFAAISFNAYVYR